MAEEKAPDPLPETLPDGVVASRLSRRKLRGVALRNGDYYFTHWTGPDGEGEYEAYGGCVSPYGIDWSSVAALRTPPSPPSEAPNVGETWVVAFVKGGKTEPEEHQVVVGHALEAGNGAAIRPTIDGIDNAAFLTADHVGKYRTLCLIRRLTPAASPSPPVDSAHIECPDCKTETFHLARQRCDRCGLTNHVLVARATATPPVEKVAERVDPPAAKFDPDGFLNREALDERRRGERLDFGARRLAAVQAHKLDLDRKIPTVRGRLAVEVKAALVCWPSQEDD